MISIDDYHYNPRQRPLRSSSGGRVIDRMIEGAAMQIDAISTLIVANLPDLRSIGKASESEQEPYWSNPMQPVLDGALLYSLIKEYNPKTYFEIGSGNSTKFVRRAIRDHSLRTRIVSVDPEPRAEVDSICDTVIRQPLEDVLVLPDFEPGDVVFVDNSHRTFQNSDVTIFFIEILPALPSGVIYGLHDIFLPDDYPAEWRNRFYNEQYMLASYLIGGAGQDSVIYPAMAVWNDLARRHALAHLIDDPYFAGCELHGGGFWMRRG